MEKDVQLFLGMRQKLVWKYAKLKVSKHKDEDICRVTPWPNFIDINDVILNIVHCSIIKSNHTTTIVIAVSNTVSESFPRDEGFFFIVPRPYILFFFMIMFKTIKTAERHHWRRSNVFFVNIEQISHIVLSVSIVDFD